MGIACRHLDYGSYKFTSSLVLPLCDRMSTMPLHPPQIFARGRRLEAQHNLLPGTTNDDRLVPGVGMRQPANVPVTVCSTLP